MAELQRCSNLNVPPLRTVCGSSHLIKLGTDAPVWPHSGALDGRLNNTKQYMQGSVFGKRTGAGSSSPTYLSHDVSKKHTLVMVRPLWLGLDLNKTAASYNSKKSSQL